MVAKSWGVGRIFLSVLGKMDQNDQIGTKIRFLGLSPQVLWAKMSQNDKIEYFSLRFPEAFWAKRAKNYKI